MGSHWLRFGIKLLLQVLLPAGELSHVIDQQASQHSFRAGRGGWGWRSAWLPACATGPSGRQGICPPPQLGHQSQAVLPQGTWWVGCLG